ncbi:hypothetical protein KIH31_08895 [Paenarthrobacter sp. DKR-5]|uniref:hypothetical protein n=1 Tax=Paenarthrobacter sp. DKR-5 TaxID=2835535 RepID=UPI001BDD9CD2|nr:hypothetical protein [Paenarthrobacter sp. DKR-5]MBT1002720.1 hypothetical protein [Paenarthrobacter sp. DKR-5]
MEDVEWRREGPTLAQQPPGPELVRRLADIDIDVLTEDELLEYLAAARSQAAWADSLQERAIGLFAARRRCPVTVPAAARKGSPKSTRSG